MNSWKITSTLLPLILGAAVTIGFYFIDRTRFIVKGVVGPYFASVALLFALFSSSMTTEVWQKVNRANSLLIQEANSARSLLRISEPLGPEAGVVRNAVITFLKQIEVQEIAESVSPSAMPRPRPLSSTESPPTQTYSRTTPPPIRLSTTPSKSCAHLGSSGISFARAASRARNSSSSSYLAS